MFLSKTGIQKTDGFHKSPVRSILLHASIIMVLILSNISCGDGKSVKSTTSQKQSKIIVKPKLSTPVFNADSAYYFVEKQLSFGPRVPETEAHEACALWLEATLGKFADSVMVQEFKARVYDNRIFSGKNIIASFKPDFQNRIFLSSHWDSRPYADHDPDVSKHDVPIDGANDGASGTGVLIEIARQLSIQNPGIGIDIVLFDLEDYGPPQDSQTDQASETWGLGSQYWARNFHVPGYSARYGILLDMVGASDAIFPLEGFSMYYAPDIVKKVWNIAGEIGYGDYFVFDNGGYITDDHYFVNLIAQIPTINIIHLDPASVNGTFYDHWHTVNDNLEQIEPATLKVVGQTVLEVIFRE
ncbi:MAG: M28 family peptidase [Bacteroidales bacterium]|nr:M28 family peptidase [Bacteroidales bacterium]